MEYRLAVAAVPDERPAPKRPRRQLPVRALLLAAGAICLLTGLAAGLARAGIAALPLPDGVGAAHGQLLVLGFLGTLIALERAIAVGRNWAFLAPFLFGTGGLLLTTPLAKAGQWLQVLGAIALTACYRAVWRRQPSNAAAVQGLGAAMAIGAALLFAAGVAAPVVLPWMASFLVLTIAGERLELAPLSIGTGREAPALWAAFAVATGAAAMTVFPTVGTAVFGTALLALVAWLIHVDIARRTIHTSGLPRFTAACLLAGYAWSAVAGATWLLGGPQYSGAGYDIVIHSVFLGFAMSMVFGHAPIILPAVLGRPLPYRSVMWLPVAVLQASLLLRLAIGDGRDVAWAWQAGAIGNGVALLLFGAIGGYSVVKR